MTEVPFIQQPPSQTRRSGRLRTLFYQWRQTRKYSLQALNLALSPLPELFGGGLRARAYRSLGVGVGANAVVLGNIRLIGPQPGLYGRLQIGDGATVGYDVVFVLDDSVSIGANASISAFVRVFTGSHPVGPASSRKVHATVRKPVRIGDGAWIGTGAILLPGVTIGRGSIVGAGAIVAEDVPDNVYVEGNPARFIRNLPWGNR